MIDEVRAHVAERALTPVDPPAPAARVIDRVIVDRRSDAKEQVPGHAVGHRVLAGERGGKSCFDAGAVPRQRPLRVLRRERRWTRDSLRPVSEGTVRPDVHLTDVANRAAGDVFVPEPRAVGGVALVAHLGYDAGGFRL